LSDSQGATTMPMRAAAAKNVAPISTRPFSSVGAAVKLGVAGIGFDVATPLAKKLNLRGGASFFGYSPNLTEDGINITGSLSFKSINTSVDYFPFHGSFHLSPGVILYNGNHIAANAAVPGTQSFTLNDTTYYSSTADPVHGIFNVQLGNKVAPSFTIGWGNLIPRNGGHWSVPFEIGFEYISQPKLTLDLQGSTCTNSNNTGCSPIASNPTTQANVTAEQNNLQSDISGLQVYPILSIGVGYKF
jgi:hypothetical protein